MFFVNRNYIAQEVCINRFDLVPLCKGSCFLEDQLNQNEQQQDTLPDLKASPQSLWTVQVINNTPAISVQAVPEQNFFSYYNQLLPHVFLQGLLKPPPSLA